MRCLLFSSAVLQCGQSPNVPLSLLYLKPLRSSNTFLHVIYKSKKKTNLLRTRNEMRRKALKQTKFGIQPFWNPESTELESGIQYSESGIHRVESRIQDCHGFPYMGRFNVIFRIGEIMKAFLAL